MNILIELIFSYSFPDFLLHPFRKPKRVRTAFSPGQLLKLEHAFESNQYVVGAERKALAQALNLSETQVSTRYFIWKSNFASMWARKLGWPLVRSSWRFTQRSLRRFVRFFVIYITRTIFDFCTECPICRTIRAFPPFKMHTNPPDSPPTCEGWLRNTHWLWCIKGDEFKISCIFFEWIWFHDIQGILFVTGMNRKHHWH